MGPGWAATRHQLPPLWVDKVDGVEEDVRLIQLKRETLLRNARVWNGCALSNYLLLLWHLVELGLA